MQVEKVVFPIWLLECFFFLVIAEEEIKGKIE
jgi:hypothetical protein